MSAMFPSLDGAEQGCVFVERHPPEWIEHAWVLLNRFGDLLGEVRERQVPRSEGLVTRWVPYDQQGLPIHAGSHGPGNARKWVEERAGIIAGTTPVHASPEALRVELADVEAKLADIDTEMIELTGREVRLKRRRLQIMAQLAAPPVAAVGVDETGRG